MSKTTTTAIAIARAAAAAFAAADRAAFAAAPESHAQYWAWYDRLLAAQEQAHACAAWAQSYQDEGIEIPAHVTKAARAAEEELQAAKAAAPVQASMAWAMACNRLADAQGLAAEAGTRLAIVCRENIDLRRLMVTEGLVTFNDQIKAIVPRYGAIALIP